MVRPWIERFTDFMAYLRDRGWRRVFILDGNNLRAPGMVKPDDLARFCAAPSNDNRTRR